MAKGLVTVFGAGGFLGRRVLRELVKDGWRIRAAVRRPHIAQDLRVIGAVGQIQIVQANIRYKTSVEQALDGADAVINLAGILYNTGRQTFGAVHNQGVKTLAAAAKAKGITNIVHLSALGAGKQANSEYASSKTEGEIALKAAMPSADILRPSILFGQGGGFFDRFAKLSQLALVLPLIGGGKTRFAPVHVGDVAKAVSVCIGRGSAGTIYELGGPNSYTFKQLLDFMFNTMGKKRLLLPVPWFVGTALGWAGEISGWLPFVKPFLTRDQVQSLRFDNVPGGELPGLSELGIDGETIEAVIPTALEPFRKYGQFYQQAAD